MVCKSLILHSSVEFSHRLESRGMAEREEMHQPRQWRQRRSQPDGAYVAPSGAGQTHPILPFPTACAVGHIMSALPRLQRALGSLGQRLWPPASCVALFPQSVERVRVGNDEVGARRRLAPTASGPKFVPFKLCDSLLGEHPQPAITSKRKAAESRSERDLASSADRRLCGPRLVGRNHVRGVVMYSKKRDADRKGGGPRYPALEITLSVVVP